MARSNTTSSTTTSVGHGSLPKKDYEDNSKTSSSDETGEKNCLHNALGDTACHCVETWSTITDDDAFTNTSASSDEASTSDIDFDIISIVKEELKQNIHRRRQEKGLQDINVDQRTSRSYQLTQIEQMKRQQRKERNRIAAAKCRDKKRQLTLEIIKETDRLEKSNHDLQRRAQDLKAEKAILQQMLEDHLMICPKRHQLLATEISP